MQYGIYCTSTSTFKLICLIPFVLLLLIRSLTIFFIEMRLHHYFFVPIANFQGQIVHLLLDTIVAN